MFIYHANFTIGYSISIDFFLEDCFFFFQQFALWVTQKSQRCCIPNVGMSLRNLEFRFLSKTWVLKHCCVVPNAPEGIKFHTVSCAILSLHVKVNLPLSFLRFLCLWQGLTLLFAPCSSRAPQDDPHAQKPQTGQSPAHPQHTVSSPHDWTHINTRSRSDGKQKKTEKLAGILFLFEAGGRVSDFAFELL